MSVSITWHGHSTFTVDVDGIKLLVDPYFDDNPSAIVAARDVQADYILLTHGHFDHVTDALPIALRTGAKVIANFEIVHWVTGKGYANCHGQHIGGGCAHDCGHVKFTPALHGSMLPDGSYGGMPVGLLLTVGGKRIYISGDTGLFSDMALIGEAGLDVAVVCIGDNFTMGPEDSVRALQYLKPKYAIPCHYNTWPLIAVDVELWARQVAENTGSRPVVLEVESSFVVP